jgi:hypothetical protein
MNLLLKDNKFGFTKFSDDCECAGGGGGGSQVCTTPYTQTKWEPNGTPKVPTPAPVEEGFACYKVYTGSPFNVKWNPEPKAKTEDPVAGKYKCDPEKGPEPCECGNSKSDNKTKKEPPDPDWGSGTDESKTCTATYSCSYIRSTTPNPPTLFGYVISCGPGSGTDDNLSTPVEVPGKRYNRSWSLVTTFTVSCESE